MDQVQVRRCLDDAELLALIEHQMTQTARELAFVHVDACVACLELVAALLRSFEPRRRAG